MKNKPIGKFDGFKLLSSKDIKKIQQQNKNWQEKFDEEFKFIKWEEDPVNYFGTQFREELLKFISQLLSELSSDFEECVGEDETEEDADYYLGHNEAKSEIKEKIKSVKDKWGL